MLFNDEIYVERMAMRLRAENRVKAAQAAERVARAEAIKLAEEAQRMADKLGIYAYNDAAHKRLVALNERAKRIVAAEGVVR